MLSWVKVCHNQYHFDGVLVTAITVVKFRYWQSAAPVIDDRAIRIGTTTFPESEFQPVQLLHTL